MSSQFFMFSFAFYSFFIDLLSFTWKLIHGLLPNPDRVSRILTEKTPLFNLCQKAVIENPRHAFFRCSYTTFLGNFCPTSILVYTWNIHQPNPSPQHGPWTLWRFLHSMGDSTVKKNLDKLPNRTGLHCHTTYLGYLTLKISK